MTELELAKEQAEKTHLTMAGHKYGGEFTRRQESGVVNLESLKTKPSKAGRSLESFVDEGEAEEDIYEMYQRKINERPVQSNQSASQEVNYKIDKETLDPEMPRFEDFMNQKSDQIHPFDKITD